MEGKSFRKFPHWCDGESPRRWIVTTTILKPESIFCFSVQAQIIAQAIGQAFGVAYQQFLEATGIKTSDLQPGEYSNYLESQELYNGDLAHFSDSQNIRDVSSCSRLTQCKSECQLGPADVVHFASHVTK